MLRNLGIRWQILAALALPLLVLVALGGRVTDQSVQDMHDAQEALDLSSTASSVTELVRGLGSERLLTVGALSGSATARTQLAPVRAANDVRLQRIHSGIETSGLPATYRAVLTSSDAGHAQLSTLRAAVDAGTVTAPQAAVQYTKIVAADVDLPAEIATRLPDRATAASFRRFGALSAATEALSQEQLTGLMIAVTGQATLQQQRQLEASQALQVQQIAEFDRAAPAAQRAALKSALTSRAGQTKQLDALRAQFLAAGTSPPAPTLNGAPGPSAAGLAGATAGPTGATTGAAGAATGAADAVAGATGAGVTALALPPRVEATRWIAVTGSRITTLGTVLDTVAKDGVTQAQDQLSSARLRAEVTAGASAVAVLIMLLAAMLMSRRISQPLRRLTLAATRIRDELPQLVEQVQAGTDAGIETLEVPVTGRNEVGRLAAAFTDVNRVTVQVAREQAQLRAAVGDMFVNVARRNQVLLARQLAFIDLLERNEANPDALEELFRLDHLATRMRRNAESLLVLAGIESGRRLREPMLLSDVIRTATSEIEHYERVSLALGTDPSVFAHLALPVAHLLAELLENATNFSEPGSTVVVMAAATPEGVRVTVADDGLGITADELAEINSRIENPPAADALGSQRLGFFVVGRLAQRLEATVLLTSGRAGGTAVLIDLPASLFLAEAAPELPDPERQIVMAPELEQAEAAMALELSSQLDGPGLHDLVSLDEDHFGESPFPAISLGAAVDEHAEAAQAYGVGQAAPVAGPAVSELPVSEPVVFPSDLSAEAYGALAATGQGYEPEIPAPAAVSDAVEPTELPEVPEPSEPFESAGFREPELGTERPNLVDLDTLGYQPLSFEPRDHGTSPAEHRDLENRDLDHQDLDHQDLDHQDPHDLEPVDVAPSAAQLWEDEFTTTAVGYTGPRDDEPLAFEPREADFQQYGPSDAGSYGVMPPAEAVGTTPELYGITPAEEPVAPAATNFFRRRPPVEPDTGLASESAFDQADENPATLPSLARASLANDTAVLLAPYLDAGPTETDGRHDPLSDPFAPAAPPAAGLTGSSLFSGFRSRREPVAQPEPDSSAALSLPEGAPDIAPEPEPEAPYQPESWPPADPDSGSTVETRPVPQHEAGPAPELPAAYERPSLMDELAPLGPVPSRPAHLNEQPHTFAPEYGTPEYDASLQQPQPPLHEIPLHEMPVHEMPVQREPFAGSEGLQLTAPLLPQEPAPWENFVRRDILPQKPASLRDALRFGRRSPAPAPGHDVQPHLLPGAPGRSGPGHHADARLPRSIEPTGVPLMRRYRDDGTPRPTQWPAAGDGPGWANSGLPMMPNSAPEPGNPSQAPGRPASPSAAAEQGAGWPETFGMPAHLAPQQSYPNDTTAVPVPRSEGSNDTSGIAGFGAADARSDAQDRSHIASQALSELSRLSSYSPAVETSDRSGLQRRTPAPVPSVAEPAVQSSGQRARTAANVRAMLSGFKAGVERGRTSPRSRSGPADRARNNGGSDA